MYRTSGAWVDHLRAIAASDRYTRWVVSREVAMADAAHVRKIQGKVLGCDLTEPRLAHASAAVWSYDPKNTTVV